MGRGRGGCAAGAPIAVIIFVTDQLCVAVCMRQSLILREQLSPRRGSDLSVSLEPRCSLEGANGTVGGTAEPTVYVKRVSQTCKYRLKPTYITAVHE